MGGSKSSSAASTSQTDNRRVLGENAISAEGSTVTINTLDGQVVNRALDTADLSVGKALTFADSTQAKAYQFANTSADRAMDALDTTTELVKDAYQEAKGRGELTDQIIMGALVMAGLVAFAAVRK
jgi:hypothetical protein